MFLGLHSSCCFIYFFKFDSIRTICNSCLFFCCSPALTYTVNWEADENGFRADAPHLPQPVAIPFPEVAEAVEAQLRFAASQPAYVEPEN